MKHRFGCRGRCTRPGDRSWRAWACVTWWLLVDGVWGWLGLALTCIGLSIWLD